MEQTKPNKKEIVVAKERGQVVTYKVGNQEITLHPQAVKMLTNDNKYINEGEISMFIELCKYQELNPFIKEAYLVKYDNSKPAQQVTALSAFSRKADDNPNFSGMEDGIVVKSGDKIIKREGCMLYPNETLLGGWAKVYRSDRQVPTYVELSLKEYSKGQSTWNVMPATMINKCAKVGALRKAFPSTFSGMYIADEMSNETKQDNSYEVVDIDDIIDGEIITENVINEEPIQAYEEEIMDLPEVETPFDVEETENDSELICADCGMIITEKVYDFSKDKFNKPLCFQCQKKQ